MGKKTPPFELYPEWTTARFFSFLRSGLRATFNRYPPKYNTLLGARRPAQSEDSRLKWEYQCAECKNWFPKKEVECDHITPAGTLKSFEDLAEFVRKLAGPQQVLCRTCHTNKTNNERAAK
jgi:hypothetical protein